MAWLKRSCENSKILRTKKASSDFLKMCINSSSLIGAFKRKKDALVLSDSKIIGYGLKIYDRFKKSICQYMLTSKIAASAHIVRSSILFNPLRAAGIIILTATITNITISILSAKVSGPLTWFIRVNFIIIGTIWALCKCNPREMVRRACGSSVQKKDQDSQDNNSP
jgi:hypothetical protein